LLERLVKPMALDEINLAISWLRLNHDWAELSQTQPAHRLSMGKSHERP